jgi:hypothetical protein
LLEHHVLLCLNRSILPSDARPVVCSGHPVTMMTQGFEEKHSVNALANTKHYPHCRNDGKPLEERLPAFPARLKVARILLCARPAKNRSNIGRGPFMGSYQLPCAAGIPVIHHPDLGIRFAKGNISQPALGILVKYPRLDAGPRQQIGHDMRIWQVGSGIHFDHATSVMEKWRIAARTLPPQPTLSPSIESR